MCWASVVNAIPGACLASFAIRSSFVQTVVEPDVSSIFPSSGSVSRHPLPSTGSLGSVPPLRRYYGNARTPGHPSRLASFPSLGATTVRPLLSPLPPAWGATLQGRGLSRGSPSRSVGGNGWASQVPGGPSRACPALRPRRDRHAKPLRRVDVAFRNFGTRRLPPLSISGLNHTACALAVYASQPGSPLDHARLASGWGLALAGRAWLPARSLVKFPRYFMASSSPRLRLAHPKLDSDGGRADGAERPLAAMSLVLAVLGAARAALSTHTDLALENLALRQQLALLRHRSKRPRFGGLDRAFWVWFSRRWAGWHDALHVVRPETVIRWHRPRLSRVLDLEVAKRANGSTVGRLGGCKACPDHGARESPLGRAAHPR